MWGSGSPQGITAASLVYALSRYALIIQNILAIATNYPMSNLVSNLPTLFRFNILMIPCLEVVVSSRPCIVGRTHTRLLTHCSCRANACGQVIARMLGTISFGGTV